MEEFLNFMHTLLTKIQIDKTFGMEVILVFIQTARDYWTEVMNDPWMKGKLNYEKYQVRYLLGQIERTLKNRFRAVGGYDGVDLHNELMTKMADFADDLKPLLDDCWNKTKDSIMQKLPWDQQNVLLNSSFTTICVYWANQAVSFSGLTKFSKTLEDIIAITNNFPITAKLDIWSGMKNIVRTEWTQPIVDKAIELCNTDARKYIKKEPGKAEPSREDKIKEMCDRLVAAS